MIESGESLSYNKIINLFYRNVAQLHDIKQNEKQPFINAKGFVFMSKMFSAGLGNLKTLI